MDIAVLIHGHAGPFSVMGRAITEVSPDSSHSVSSNHLNASFAKGVSDGIRIEVEDDEARKISACPLYLSTAAACVPM